MKQTFIQRKSHGFGVLATVTAVLASLLIPTLKADMAAGKVTQIPTLDGRVKKVG